MPVLSPERPATIFDQGSFYRFKGFFLYGLTPLTTGPSLKGNFGGSFNGAIIVITPPLSG
jgi:hypothetical protein